MAASIWSRVVREGHGAKESTASWEPRGVGRLEPAGRLGGEGGVGGGGEVT